MADLRYYQTCRTPLEKILIHTIKLEDNIKVEKQRQNIKQFMIDYFATFQEKT